MTTERTKTLTISLRRNLLAGTAATLMLFVGVGGWAATSQLSNAVIASGTLVIDGSAKKVQHPNGGVISELFVKEGQRIASGDIIARLDDTGTRASLAAVTKGLNQLYAREGRLEAELNGAAMLAVPAELPKRLRSAEIDAAMATERRLFQERLVSREGIKAQLREQIKQLREQIIGLDVQKQSTDDEIALIAKELEGKTRLYEQGLITMSQVNALERNAARLRGERGQLMASIAAYQGKIAETELRLLDVDHAMRAEVAAEIRDVQNKQTELVEQEVTALDQLKHVEIKAPVSGTIHQLAVHTIGGVITAAEVLMQIVPQENALTVEARIPPQDIDQIAPGQSATLHLSAFNRNTTPELSGILNRLSADLETDERTGVTFYRASIVLPEAELAKIPNLTLMPGMPVEAFITTGDRTVASYFLKPIRDHANRAFRQE
ncbi:HlyD family type I secretion periplasmic adaptor subunit [Agrobacterium tumefaciens]|uniref:Membrane fusion protein (MFP) family protein n=1 Tax=Agrobacterium tumefaciens TaxID=358 RepID=A0A2L2LMQ4_AGRTU|nr:HlyD family type I secretion periplasmic adaptor subunit [Agrobacterium tumefaciens]AVH45614.1 HlyD family secretion protein [Agrobacterium tumefaciens]NSY99274.1 HlyD family type I secretion periplasmic adaptor subunit [Agrobacterium tumefaciens]